MPIETTDMDGGMGVLFIGHGHLEDQAFVTAYKAHLTQDEEKFSKYRYSLSDFSGVNSTDVTSASIDYIARLCISASTINPHPIVAWVAKEDFVFGLSRMAETLMSETNWETRVFRTRQDAVTWIRRRVKDKFGTDDIALT